MHLLLITTALAGPRIVSVGEPLLADGAGNWPRLFPREDGGWALITANQSGLIYTGLDAAFARETGSNYQLVSDTSLIDHAYATCPDGTVLHVGMGTRTSEQHTAFVRRFDASWSLLSTSTVIDDDPQANIVDQGAVCGESFQGFGYLHAGELNDEGDAVAPEARLFLFDGADMPVGEALIADVFNPTGMSLFERDGQLIAIGNNIPEDQSLRIVTLDAGLNKVDDRKVQVVDEGIVYWPQAAVDIGGDTFVVYIRQADRTAWSGQFGDVHLVQFDADWNVVDNVAIYALGPGYGGFQPGLARRGDELVVTFSEPTHLNKLVLVTLDTSEVDTGTEDTDTGPADTDTGPVDTAPEDTDTEPPDTAETDTPDTDSGDPPAATPEDPGCGCGHGNAAALGWPLLLALAFSRRRSAR